MSIASMLFLINADFKAIRTGAFVVADESAAEFIYDGANREALTMGQMEELASANGIEIVAKKKSDYQDKLNQGLAELDLPTQNEPTDSVKVEEIVRAGVADDKTDDQMLIEIVTAGISFRKAGKMFKDTLERLGLRVSLKDVKVEANNYLEDIRFSPTTYAEVEAAIEDVVKSVEGATHQQARTAVRKYAKDNEIALPKPEKGQRGAVGFKVKVFDWILQNPDASVKELGEWAESKGKDAEKIEKQFGPVFELCKQFAKAQNDEDEVKTEEAA